MPGNNFNFPPVRAGAPLIDVCGASYHNAIRQALKWVNAQQNRSGSGSSRKSFSDPGIVWIKNASGADVVAGGILGIDTSVPVTPTDNLIDFQLNHVLQGITPVASHLGKFVVCYNPIPSGQIGEAGIIGVFVCQVNSADSSSHDYADIAEGHADYLAAGSSGAARILWRESGSGTKWAVVRMGGTTVPLSWIECTPTGTFTTMDNSFSATVTVSHGAPDAAAATVTVNNTSGIFSGNTNSKCIAIYQASDDAYYAWQMSCPT